MFARAAWRRELRSLSASSSALLSARLFSSTAPAQADFSHVVIGGGVIGLAIGRRLAAQDGSPATLLVERHGQVGTETSSRNSEVIHAGLYYGAQSLKTRLCVRGRDALYRFCAARGVAHRRTGKWIVAQDAEEMAALERIAAHCAELAVEPWEGGEEGRGEPLRAPVRFLTREEARRLEPAVRADAGVLESPETGIVDSHGLMLALQGLFEDAGGVTALGSEVVSIEPLPSSSSVPGSGGWRLTVRDTATPEGETSTIEAETIINSAGLGAGDVHNMMVAHAATSEAERERRKVRLHYAKGSYFSYGASTPRVGRLIYPAPSPGHAGLGTHLTLDLAGRVRFGPDAEWIESATGEGALRVSAARLPQALEEIRRYLPAVDGAALAPDYAGIRPKLGRLSGTVGVAQQQGKGAAPFQDFYIKREEGFEGWVNLLGMESPGLTSCLAVAEYVRDLLYASRSPGP